MITLTFKDTRAVRAALEYLANQCEDEADWHEAENADRDAAQLQEAYTDIAAAIGAALEE